MVPVVRGSIVESGFSSATLVLAVVFFLTSMRFFIGNQLHLVSDLLVGLPGKVWLYDFLFIIGQSVLLIFLGGVTSVEASRESGIDFIWLLVALYAVDVGWISFQWVLGWIADSWRRPAIAWQWAALNSALIAGIVLTVVTADDPYSRVPIAVLAALNAVAFVVDLIMLDVQKLVGRRIREKGDSFMEAALEEAQIGLEEGGIPIGAVLVRDGEIIGRGRNRRVQDGDPSSHAEIDCLRSAGRVESYEGTTMYSTLMPCHMCAGAVVQFGIGRLIVGESVTFAGAREFMQSRGIEVVDMNTDESRQLMRGFVEAEPALWSEDIGTM